MRSSLARPWWLSVVLLAGLVPVTAGAQTTDRSTDANGGGGGEPAGPPSMFEKGTWTLEFSGGTYDDVFTSGEKHHVGAVGTSYYFADRHSVRAELTGYGLDAKDGNDDTTAFGSNVGLRFHFLEYERLTLFADGFVGFYYADHKFPPGGTHFNYTVGGGVGATFRVYENVHLFGAARYLHASNARIHGDDENPSVDAFGGYVGVLFTF